MKPNIFTKLLLAVFLSLLLILAAMMGSLQWSFQRGFEQYLENREARRIDRLSAVLETEYAERGDWDFLRGNHEAWFVMLRQVFEEQRGGPPPPPPPPPPGSHVFPLPGSPAGEPFSADGPPPPHHQHPPRFGPERGPPHADLVRRGHLRVLDGEKRQVVGPPFPADPGAREVLRPLHHEGRVVGWLGFLPHRSVPDELEQAFLQQTIRSSLYVLGLAVLVSLGVSLLLARLLVRPVRRLANGARALAAGDYSVRIAAFSHDELGRLAEDFNALALTLQRNEEARRQWLADTSHELRTPLAILRSEVEALLDGVRQPTADRLRSLHGEIMHMSKLVDDLHQLALHDLAAVGYRMECLDLAGVLADLADAFRPRFATAGIALTAPLPGVAPVRILGDPARLRQLFGNLLENTLRYADRGATCRLELRQAEGKALAAVEDSGPGVPDAALARLFDRFYRTEKSRSRHLGGSGLGLAICRSIAEAHGGSLAATHSRLGGLRIRLELPLAPD